MKDKVFSLNMALKYVRSYYICIRYVKPEHAKMDHAEQNHAEQNKACITTSSKEICILLRDYAE